MTKIYHGNGIYELHFCTGKKIELTEEEINDLVEDSDIVEELQEELNDSKKEALDTQKDLSMYQRTFKDIKTLMDKLEK